MLAGVRLVCGWLWQVPGLIGSGAGWLVVLPWLLRRPWHWAMNALLLSAAGLAGFGLGHFGAVTWLFKLFTCIANLGLAGYFLHTLIPPNTALVTAIGEASRGPLGPHLRAYTCAVTWFWGLFLLVCGVLSLGHLLNLEPLAAWHWLPNWQLPLSLVVFVGEFYLRKRLFPAHNHPGFWEYLIIVARAMAHPPRTR